MREVEFSFKRRRPEDFIVKEVSDFEEREEGPHYLYLLAKRNYTTKEIAKAFNLSYAGMKDKFALTFQKVSSSEFLGDLISDGSSQRWFALKFLKRIGKKVKIGQLKGNRFAVNLKGFLVKEVRAFINYYDSQRLSGNFERGRELFKEFLERPKRRLKWSENYLLDSYLSYLWNRSLELYLKEKFSGYYVLEGSERFFIPQGLEERVEELPKFWTILGYKKKLLTSQDYYEVVLKEEGFTLSELLEGLRALGIKGDYRMSYVLVREFKLIGSYGHFFLPKGSFGTMFLKHLQAV
ncbi:tRNA pseudouridine(13) synthase TruD [Thermovibrio sp.]